MQFLAYQEGINGTSGAAVALEWLREMGDDWLGLVVLTAGAVLADHLKDGVRWLYNHRASSRSAFQNYLQYVQGRSQVPGCEDWQFNQHGVYRLVPPGSTVGSAKLRLTEADRRLPYGTNDKTADRAIEFERGEYRGEAHRVRLRSLDDTEKMRAAKVAARLPTPPGRAVRPSARREALVHERAGRAVQKPNYGTARERSPDRSRDRKSRS